MAVTIYDTPFALSVHVACHPCMPSLFCLTVQSIDVVSQGALVATSEVTGGALKELLALTRPTSID